LLIGKRDLTVERDEREEEEEEREGGYLNDDLLQMRASQLLDIPPFTVFPSYLPTHKFHHRKPMNRYSGEKGRLDTKSGPPKSQFDVLHFTFSCFSPF